MSLMVVHVLCEAQASWFKPVKMATLPYGFMKHARIVWEPHVPALTEYLASISNRHHMPDDKWLKDAFMPFGLECNGDVPDADTWM